MSNQKKINICTSHNNYPIFIGKNILKNFNKYYLSHCPKSKKILFVTNLKIPNIYLRNIKSKITNKSKIYIINIPAGEKNKNLLVSLTDSRTTFSSSTVLCLNDWVCRL